MAGADLPVEEASSGADQVILDAPTPSQANIEASNTNSKPPTADSSQTAVVDAMEIAQTSSQVTHSGISEPMSNSSHSTPAAGSQSLQIVIPSVPVTTASESVATKSATTTASSTPVSTNQSASNTPITETPPALQTARWRPQYHLDCAEDQRHPAGRAGLCSQVECPCCTDITFFPALHRRSGSDKCQQYWRSKLWDRGQRASSASSRNVLRVLVGTI